MFFLNMGLARPLFVYNRLFHITIQLQIEISLDIVLGIRTRGLRMVGADGSIELWRPPNLKYMLMNNSSTC